MSTKGDCWDNAVAQTYLKTEVVHHADYESRAKARSSIFEYIEVFYNRHWSPSANGNETPLVFEIMKRAA